jgi:hypothetical protein
LFTDKVGFFLSSTDSMAPRARRVGLVLGHSFVKSFHHHIANKIGSFSPHRLAEHLQVHHLVKDLHFAGYGGACAMSDPLPFSSRKIRSIRPDFIVLDLGSNDLASGTPPLDLAVRIVDIAKFLVEHYHVRHVAICSLVNRTAGLSISEHEFQARAFSCNKYLMDLCEDEPRVHYFVHKGFWQYPVDQWSDDGIHPRTRTGRKKYMASIRKAVFKTLEKFTLPSVVVQIR